MSSQLFSEASQSVQEHLDALELENELYRRAQVALEAESEGSLSVFEDAPVGLFVLDPSGAIKMVNRRGAKSLGIPADELFNQDFRQFVCGPSGALFVDHLALAKPNASRHGATSDLLLCRNGGDSFWARTRSEFSPTADRRCPGIIVTVDEIDDLMLDMRSQVEVVPKHSNTGARDIEGLGGCILLVDDEELILNSVSRVLHRLGYDIVSFTDPNAALAAFAESPNTYDAVISDYQMPEMNGLEFCEQIVQLRGDVPILLTSAFIGEIDQTRAKDVGVEYVMPKPLSADELTFWLNEVMPELPGLT